jgi:ketosteroid isomerase-like protein
MAGSYRDFAGYIATGKQRYQEKFSNLRIDTDGIIASLYFDYVFLIDDKENNRGDETWHLVRTAAGGKISSLRYSVAAAPERLAADETSTDSQRLLELERTWSDAQIKHDAAGLRRILDDHFICPFGTSAPVDKEHFIQVILAQDMLSQQPSEASVIVDRDTGVIVDTFTVRGTENGQTYTRVYRITSTYVRRDGQWKVLAEQVESVAS